MDTDQLRQQRFSLNREMAAVDEQLRAANIGRAKLNGASPRVLQGVDGHLAELARKKEGVFGKLLNLL